MDLSYPAHKKARALQRDTDSYRQSLHGALLWTEVDTTSRLFMGITAAPPNTPVKRTTYSNFVKENHTG